MSLNLTHDPNEPLRAAIANIDRAHAWLDQYLGEEANYVRSVLSSPQSDDVQRRVIAYTDDNFVPTETHAVWRHGSDPLSAFVARSEIFADVSSLPSEDGSMMFRV